MGRLDSESCNEIQEAIEECEKVDADEW